MPATAFWASASCSATIQRGSLTIGGELEQRQHRADAELAPSALVDAECAARRPSRGRRRHRRGRAPRRRGSLPAGGSPPAGGVLLELVDRPGAAAVGPDVLEAAQAFFDVAVEVRLHLAFVVVEGDGDPTHLHQDHERRTDGRRRSARSLANR